MVILFDQYEQNVLNGVYGQGIDMDGEYGYQCWDQAAHFAREVAGSPAYPWVGTYTGNAKDVYIHFDDTINPNFFTRIANEHGNPDQLPQRGDLIVANGNAGHIASVRSADGDGIDLIEQWGLTPSVGFSFVRRSWSSLPWLGWLRPLIDVNARVNAPDERTVTPGGPANARTGPGTNYDKVVDKSIAAGDYGKFKGYVIGETVTQDGYTSNIWLVGAFAGMYYWLGSFTKRGVEGIPLISSDPVIVTPPVVWPEYKFTAFSPVVDRVVPAHPSNFQLGRFPADPLKAVMHDFGTRGTDTLESVENYFTGDHTTDEAHQVSAHVAIGWNEKTNKAEILEMVSIANGDRAWGSGPNGNDYYQVEIDPIVGYIGDDKVILKKKVAVVAKVRLFMEALRDYKGRAQEQIKHSSIMQTSCGDDIELSLYAVDPFKPTEPIEIPDPENPGDDTPIEPPVVKPPVVVKPYNPTKEELMAAIPPIEVESGALGAIVEDTQTRKKIYSIWIVIGLVLQGIGAAAVAGYAAAVLVNGWNWPIWAIAGVVLFAAVSGAYGALGQQVAVLARANPTPEVPTTSAKTEEKK